MNAQDKSLRTAAGFITAATLINLGGFYYASFEHIGEPTWSSHAQFHHVLGEVWLTGLAVAVLTLAWGPMQRGERWSWFLLLSNFTFAHIGFFVAQLIVPEGRPPILWHHLALAGVALVYATGLFLAWRRITRRAGEPDFGRGANQRLQPAEAPQQ
jgi:hypothetical protein